MDEGLVFDSGCLFSPHELPPVVMPDLWVDDGVAAPRVLEAAVLDLTDPGFSAALRLEG